MEVCELLKAIPIKTSMIFFTEQQQKSPQNHTETYTHTHIQNKQTTTAKQSRAEKVMLEGVTIPDLKIYYRIVNKAKVRHKFISRPME